MMLTIFSLFGCKTGTPESIFWSWFEKNEQRIFEFEKDQEVILDEISNKLKQYKPGLVFEISCETDGKREFVISAEGVKEYFADVKRLAESFPGSSRWTVVAFRPRMSDYSKVSVEYGGFSFEPKMIWTYHSIEDGKFDLLIYHPEYSEDKRNLFVEGSYIMLDMALGEYDVATGIRYIDHRKLMKNPKENGLKPFADLRSTFDEYKKTLR